jgi:23S rRNA pseudouridine1911/1915/1917 synthase
MAEAENITHRLRVPPEFAGERLDKALARLLPDLTRSRLQGLIAEGMVDNGERALLEPAQKLKGGEAIVVRVPPPEPAEPQPQAIPLDVVFEDKDLIVIDKPVGLVVHPAAGNREGTLVNALLAHADDLSGIGGVERPGIVHRLDKDTAGLMVVAKSERAHQGLAKQFAAHTIERVYTAFVWGVPAPRVGTIEGAIGRSPVNRRKMALVARGKPAITHYKTLATYRDIAAKVECRLETGRTHQIRVHLTSRTHPLIGDPLYGKGRRALRRDLEAALGPALEGLAGQALHAGVLGFTHPGTRKKLRFESPLPPALQTLEAALAGL